MIILKILIGLIAVFLLVNSHFIYKTLRIDKKELSPSEKFWFVAFMSTSVIFGFVFLAICIWA